jgi:hypothetical protein
MKKTAPKGEENCTPPRRKLHTSMKKTSPQSSGEPSQSGHSSDLKEEVKRRVLKEEGKEEKER